jgi:hypothetical protein
MGAGRHCTVWDTSRLQHGGERSRGCCSGAEERKLVRALYSFHQLSTSRIFSTTTTNWPTFSYLSFYCHCFSTL